MSNAIPELNNILNLFQQNDEPKAIDKLKQLQISAPGVVESIKGKLWEVCGKPLPGHPKAHDNFGEVSLFNKEPRCMSSTLEKIQAVSDIIIGLQAKEIERLNAEIGSLKAKSVTTQVSSTSTDVKVAQLAPATSTSSTASVAPVQPSLQKLPKITIDFFRHQNTTQDVYDLFVSKFKAFLGQYFNEVTETKGSCDLYMSVHQINPSRSRQEFSASKEHIEQKLKGCNCKTMVMALYNTPALKTPSTFKLMEDNNAKAYIDLSNFKNEQIPPGVYVKSDFCSAPDFQEFMKKNIYDTMVPKSEQK